MNKIKSISSFDDHETETGVAKFKFEDGQEIIIKTKNCYMEDDGGLCVFVDSSIGCVQKCRHCWLTTSKVQYKPIKIKDFEDALDGCYSEVNRRFNKFKFMGQGDPFFDIPSTIEKLNCVSPYAPRKLSFSTVMPINNDSNYVNDLYGLLNLSAQIAPTKVYVSLGAFGEEDRKILLGNVRNIYHSLEVLSALKGAIDNPKDLDIRLHYTPTNLDLCWDLNDPAFKEKLANLAKHVSMVRIIPLNANSKNHYLACAEEYIPEFQKAINSVLPCEICPRLGAEINATCGMFV